MIKKKLREESRVAEEKNLAMAGARSRGIGIGRGNRREAE